MKNLKELRSAIAGKTADEITKTEPDLDYDREKYVIVRSKKSTVSGMTAELTKDYRDCLRSKLASDGVKKIPPKAYEKIDEALSAGLDDHDVFTEKLYYNGKQVKDPPEVTVITFVDGGEGRMEVLIDEKAGVMVPGSLAIARRRSDFFKNRNADIQIKLAYIRTLFDDESLEDYIIFVTRDTDIDGFENVIDSIRIMAEIVNENLASDPESREAVLYMTAKDPWKIRQALNAMLNGSKHLLRPLYGKAGKTRYTRKRIYPEADYIKIRQIIEKTRRSL